MTGIKRIFALAVCISVSTGLSARAQSPEPRSEGEQVLLKSEQAYRSLKSYLGTSAVISVIDFGDHKLLDTASADIEFSRPGKLHIYGGGFSIISDGQKTWISRKSKDGGAFQEVENATMAIATTGSVSIAAKLIPAALGEVDIAWGFSAKLRKSAELQGHESIAGEDCLKVQAEQDHSTWTFWISSRDFLLRQAREEEDEAQLAELQLQIRQYQKLHPDPTFDEMLKTMPAEERKKIEAMTPERRERMRQSIDHPRGTIRHRMELHIFSIDSVDKPLPDTDFQKPELRRPAAQ